MVGGIRQWLLGVILTAFAGGLARQLAPKGKEESMVRLVSGLLLTLAILRPLAGTRWEDIKLDVGDLQSQAQAESYRKDGQAALSSVIAEKTEAYIWDKANRLGLDCQIKVTTAAGAGGIPLPDTVTVLGAYNEALAACMEEEVGIPAEKQIWLEEKVWTEREEKGG